MKTFKTYLAALLAITPFIFSCSSVKQVRKPPPFKFAGTTLSKDVDAIGTSVVPIHPATTFSTEDTMAVAHVKLENLSGTHKLRWDWYDPEGNLYTSSGDFPIKASTGMYSKEATAWHPLSIKGEKAEDYPGQWEVKIFLDGRFQGSTPFNMKTIADIVKLPDGLSQTVYPNDWGLIIGIEDYAHLPSVEYAKKDALIMRDYFMKVLGVPEKNIIHLLDVDATKARIEGYLRNYIPNNVSKDTTLYVYFTGHGAPDMEGGDPYLVPYDGDTLFIAQTGYSLETFYKDLNNLDVERVFIFLDSCFSGAASRAADMLIPGVKPALLHVKDVALHSDEIISFSASQTGQISNTYREAKHGLFTFFLLRALRGDADDNDDHLVSVKEVYNFVKDHVENVSHKIGRKQIPGITPSLDKLKKDIAVCKVPR